MVPVKTWFVSAAAGLALFGFSASAAQDPVGAVANAVCAAKSLDDISSTLAEVGPVRGLTNEDIAEAFGQASFLADLGRCVSPQAIADAYAAFKQGKEAQKLDAAFAMGHINGSGTGGTASAALYQGSYASLGSAGDPPSGK